MKVLELFNKIISIYDICKENIDCAPLSEYYCDIITLTFISFSLDI